MSEFKMVRSTEHFVDGELKYKTVETEIHEGDTRQVTRDHYDYSTTPPTESSTSTKTVHTEGVTEGKSSAESEEPKKDQSIDDHIESFLTHADEKMTRFAGAVDSFTKDFIKEYRKAKADADKAKGYKDKHSS